MKTSINLLGFCILFASLLFSCKKDRKDFVYSFSYSGMKLLGSPIQFESNALGNEQLKWIVDDSISFNTTILEYRFQQSGLHKVTLIVNNNKENAITQELQIAIGAERLAGTHLWKRTVTDLYVSQQIDTTYMLGDTTFAISAITDSIISVFDVPFYQSMLYHGLPLGYTDSNYVSFTTYPHANMRLVRYYVDKGNIVFFDRSGSRLSPHYTLVVYETEQ